MVLTYKDCIQCFGSDYRIKKAIREGILFKKGKGVYSDSEFESQLECIGIKYPRAIFTSESAYYYYGLTDVLPEYYFLATKREDTRIRDREIKQVFVKDCLFEYGQTEIVYQNVKISIYSRERLLVDLIRFKNKFPFDYYKEIIRNYRRIIDELDVFAMEDYASFFRNEKKIMEAIQLEVM